MGQTKLKGIQFEAFPINSVFIAIVATDPNTLLGYGTWSAIATGRVLVGYDSGDTDFDAAEHTGGSKVTDVTHTHSLSAHTHTIAHTHSHSHTHSMAHTHSFSHTHATAAASAGIQAYGATASTLTLAAHTHITNSQSTTATSAASSTVTSEASTTATSAASTTASGSPSTDQTNSSGSTTQSVMNPYFVVWMWKRTA
jgi:hypothetical protein